MFVSHRRPHGRLRGPRRAPGRPRGAAARGVGVMPAPRRRGLDRDRVQDAAAEEHGGAVLGLRGARVLRVVLLSIMSSPTITA